jgi:hypothetical protein
MEGFSFLKKPKSRKKRKGARKVALIIGAITVVLAAATAVPGYLAYRDVMALKASFKDFKDGFILQDLDRMQRALGASDTELKKIQTHTAPLNWTRAIPFVGSYKADLDRGLRAARNSIDAGQLFIDATTPNAELLGFSTEGSQAVQLSGQERISGLIELMPHLADQIDPITKKVLDINRDISKINPNRYPKKIGGFNIRDGLSQVVDTANGMAKAAPQFKEIFTIVPEEMGLNKPKTYLILFQNDKELRSTGGFWTAYAIITLDKGAIVNMSSGDMYFLDIDNKVAFYPTPPPAIATYLKLDKWYIRDVNIFPDFKVSVEKLGEFWARVPGVPAYDSVVGIDTVFVESLLRVLGPITVGGYGDFDSDNVTQKLEQVANIDRKNMGDRKDILAGLMREMIGKVFGMPSNEYDQLLSALFENLSQKHALLYFKDADAQTLAEKFNYAGRIQDFDGDYLHINDTNLAGRKANWWMEEKVTKETDKNGKTSLKIVYTNTGDYHAEWNTGYRDWVRIYVPAGSKLLSSSGSLNQVTTGEDYGKTFFEGYMAVDPKKSVTLDLEYQLPSGLDTKNLLIQKQAGTPGFEYEAKADGKTESFILDKDTEIQF